MSLDRIRRRRSIAAVALIVAVVLIAIRVSWARQQPSVSEHKNEPSSANTLVTVNSEESTGTEPGGNLIVFPKESWAAANIVLEPAKPTEFSQVIELTGKIALNDDHVAHVFPMVEGRVEEVKIQFGDRVKKGDLLVVVQSKEVGEGMLELYKHRIQKEFIETKDRWTQEVTTNTLALIELMRSGADIDEIETQLSNRSMGEYRDQLMSAYISNYKSRKDVDRLEPLSERGAVAGKQLLEAESDLNAARATLQSFKEQIQQDAKQAAAISAQAVKEIQTTVAVDETNLKILGFDDAALANLDPAQQGEAISHYPVYAPFDGTIITKDVVLLERVGPERQILSIADLSTVWVSADIYDEHLPLLRQLENAAINIRADAWPDKQFQAKVFYTGDLVDESSRTISLRAIADNGEGHLKPGMFVKVQIPSNKRNDVLQVPNAAIQEHEGKSFVYVNVSSDKFERRDVVIGARNSESTEIVAGLNAGEQVVIDGGFALKSRMLAELLAE
jgi:membrane fusion protein, heavy metal efflux system